MAIYKLARGMCPWLFKAIVLGFSLLTLSKTESEITCPEGSEVEDAPYCASWATWCEAVNGMKLVLVCSSCEGSTPIAWKYNGMGLNDTTAQLTLTRDSVRSGCYQCSCQGHDDINFAVEARNAEEPFLMVPNRTDDGQTYLIPESRTIGLTRSSSGNITVNCTGGGWPTPKVNWSSNAVPVSSDPCLFTWDDGFVLQKIIPRNPPDNFLPEIEYTCTLYNLAGTLTAKQTIIYEDMSDYFLKPAQGSITRVEVGRESYCAVYPEAGSEVLYTVCLVSDADAETCPLIAHNVSDCCVCSSPECLGLGVNTSVGPTPADANWPGVPACIVQSQSAVALGCFVQRLSSEVLSLRQFTGFILYHAHNSSVPTNEALGDNSKFFITLAFAIFGASIAIIMAVICVCTCICKKSRKIVQNEHGPLVDHQSGQGEGNREVADPVAVPAAPSNPMVHLAEEEDGQAGNNDPVAVPAAPFNPMVHLAEEEDGQAGNNDPVAVPAAPSNPMVHLAEEEDGQAGNNDPVAVPAAPSNPMVHLAEEEDGQAGNNDPAAPSNPTVYLTEEEDGQDTQTAEIAWHATTNRPIGMLQVKPGTSYTLKVPPQPEEVVMKFKTFGKACDPVSDEDVQVKPVDLAVVSNFIPRMAPKWRAIGMQLHQNVLVSILACHPNFDPVRFCEEILHAAIESGCLPNYKTLLSCLKSDGVDLAQVAADLLKDVVDVAEREKQHSCQETAESVSQSSSSSSTPTGDSDKASLLTP